MKAGIMVRIIIVVTMIYMVSGCGKMDCTDPKPDTKEQSCSSGEKADSGRVESFDLDVPHRGWPEEIVYYPNGGFEHYPVYLRDYFEQRDRVDDEFGSWKYDDIIAVFSSPAQFVGNIIILPVSMVQRCPWEKGVDRSIFPVEDQPVYEFRIPKK
ncbi:MAG: hypothetical protein JW860_05435 [Sedimentisphaerales bacterium]|nr:hypothetical protein [Sedimentisphaerales bacterium]